MHCIALATELKANQWKFKQSLVLLDHPLKVRGVVGGYWVNKKQGAIRESLLYLVDLIHPEPQNWTTPPPLGELVFRSDAPADSRLITDHTPSIRGLDSMPTPTPDRPVLASI